MISEITKIKFKLNITEYQLNLSEFKWLSQKKKDAHIFETTSSLFYHFKFVNHGKID